MKTLITFPLLLLPFFLFAQEPGFKKNGRIYPSIQYKWGIKISNFTLFKDGSTLLPFPVDKAKLIDRHLLLVTRDRKQGILDLLSGELLVPMEYKYINFDYHEPHVDHFVVYKDGKFGLIDQNNKVILPLEYEEMRMNVNTRTVVSKDSNHIWRLWSLDGQPLCEEPFEEIEETFYSPIPVKKGGKWGYIDRRGNTVLPFIFEKAEGFYLTDKMTTGYVPRQFIPGSTSEYFQILASVIINGKKKWIDQKGNYYQLPLQFLEINGIKQPFDLREYVDSLLTHETGDTIFPPYRIRVVGPNRDCFLLRFKFEDMGGGIYPHPGKVAIISGKDTAQEYMNGLWHFSTAEIESFWDSSLVYYDAIEFETAEPSPARWVFKDDQFGLIDNKGHLLLPLEYNRIGPQKEGLIPVVKDGKAGFVDASGKVLIPLQFDEDYSNKFLYQFTDGISKAYRNGKYGFINRKGVVVADFKYDAIAYFDKGIAIVYRDGKWEKLIFDE